jgi:hypothetical protein
MMFTGEGIHLAGTIMMFRVIYIDTGVERILFRSHTLTDCWKFVEIRKSCFIPEISKQAEDYIVTDSLDMKYFEKTYSHLGPRRHAYQL